MPITALGDLKVHYQQAGQGPDLVLVHGLYCNLAFWYLTVVPTLAEKFRVTVYDLRGHGLSKRLPEGYRAIDLADDLHALLDHLGITQAHVVGHSFGGAVALAFALRHASMVRSLTLADAWIPSLQPAALNSQRRWSALQTRLRAHGVEVDDPMPRVAHGFLEEILALREGDDGHAGIAACDDAPGEDAAAHDDIAVTGLVAADAPAHDPQAAATIDMMFNTRPDSQAMRSWRRLVSTTSAVADFSDPAGLEVAEISRLRRPVAAIFGARSRYLASLRGLRRNVPGCRAMLIPGAGHYFPVLRPGVFTQAVSSFAAEHSGVC